MLAPDAPSFAPAGGTEHHDRSAERVTPTVPGLPPARRIPPASSICARGSPIAAPSATIWGRASGEAMRAAGFFSSPEADEPGRSGLSASGRCGGFVGRAPFPARRRPAAEVAPCRAGASPRDPRTSPRLRPRRGCVTTRGVMQSRRLQRARNEARRSGRPLAAVHWECRTGQAEPCGRHSCAY
jgi:hypothetical protein